LSGALVGGALDWAERASLPVADLEDTATVRLALAACARSLTGKAAAGSTQRRKRSAFCNAFGYAVEQGHLASNTVDRIQWTNPAVAQSVDRRVVVSPVQARSLLAADRAGGSTWKRSSPACTAPRCARRSWSCLLAAVQGERQRAGCVFAGERGFRGGSGCGGVACDDTVSVSERDGPPHYLFQKLGEGREGARRHHCSR